MKNLLAIMLFAVSSLAIHAQTTATIVQPTVTTTVTTPVSTTTVQMPLPLKTPVPAIATTVQADRITTEIIAAASTKVVKNAPFAAEAVSESNQVLADGNRISRSVTTKMFRDSEGRFRREGSGGAFMPNGGYVPMFGLQDTISIYDPVEKVRYILMPSTKTARKSASPNLLTTGSVYVAATPTSEAYKAQIETSVVAASKCPPTTTGAAVNCSSTTPKSPVAVVGNLFPLIDGGKTESLGTKTIEGVEVEGTRRVTIIEAGAIGNERPIEIVYERWYSKELDLIVYSRHYDPRFGEQIYRLQNISRSEQDRSLFTVPADYKMTEEQMPKIYTTGKP